MYLFYLQSWANNYNQAVAAKAFFWGSGTPGVSESDTQHHVDA